MLLMLDVHRHLLFRSASVADSDDFLPAVDWAAFDSAQTPEERPALFEVYPAYEEWFKSRHLAPDGPSGAPSAARADVPQDVPPRVVERVVEIRVLVIRCKFCGNVTPVDLPVCERCGAHEFY